jgi:hypothetical protein
MSTESKQLRRKLFRGIDPGDVSRALADLAKRNVELARELDAARAHEQALQADADGFASALRQVSSLLTIAESSAAEIEAEARERAEVLGRAKLDAVADLVRLRARVDEAIASAEPTPSLVELRIG